MGWWERREKRKRVTRGVFELFQAFCCAVPVVIVWVVIALNIPDLSEPPSQIALAFATCLAGLLLYRAWDKLGAYGMVKITGRGVPEQPGASRMATKKDIEKAGLFNGDPRIHPRCGEAFGRMLYFTENSHICISGETREGKGFRFLVDMVRRLSGRSMVIMDPKGELGAMLARLRKRVSPLMLVMNPFGELIDTHPHLASCGFDPLILIDPNHREFFSKCMGIGEAMVQIDSTDPHWTRRAQLLVTALIMGAKWDEQAGKIPRATMRVFKKRLSQPYKSSKAGMSLYDTLVKMTDPKTPGYNEGVADLAQTFLVDSDDPKEIEGLLASAQGQLKFLYDETLLSDMDKHPMVQVIEGGKKRVVPFDFRMLKDQVGTVFLILPVRKLETHALWLRLLVSNVIDSWSDLPGNVRPILFLDEAGSLGNLQILVRGLSILAGMGATICTLWQRHEQITKNYKDDAGSFKSSAGFIATLQCRDQETAHYFSHRADTGTTPIDSISKPKGKDDQEIKTTAFVSHPIIHPSQVTGLPEGEALAWIGRCPYPIRLKANGYEDIKGPRVDPNPFFKSGKSNGSIRRSRRRAA